MTTLMMLPLEEQMAYIEYVNELTEAWINYKVENTPD